MVVGNGESLTTGLSRGDLVNEGLDSGPIIGFIKLKIFDTESERDLDYRIHNLEHYIYP